MVVGYQVSFYMLTPFVSTYKLSVVLDAMMHFNDGQVPNDLTGW